MTGIGQGRVMQTSSACGVAQHSRQRSMSHGGVPFTSRQSRHLALGGLSGDNSSPQDIVVENEYPDGRRQVAVRRSLPIDLGDEAGHGNLSRLGDLPQTLPELILQTDARLAAANANGPFANEAHECLLSSFSVVSN